MVAQVDTHRYGVWLPRKMGATGVPRDNHTRTSCCFLLVAPESRVPHKIYLIHVEMLGRHAVRGSEVTSGTDQ